MIKCKKKKEKKRKRRQTHGAKHGRLPEGVSTIFMNDGKWIWIILFSFAHFLAITWKTKVNVTVYLYIWLQLFSTGAHKCKGHTANVKYNKLSVSIFSNTVLSQQRSFRRNKGRLYSGTVKNIDEAFTLQKWKSINLTTKLTALFIVNKHWKQLTWAGEESNTGSPICSSKKRKEPQIHKPRHPPGSNTEQKSQSQKVTRGRNLFTQQTWNDTISEMENWSVVCQGLGRRLKGQKDMGVVVKRQQRDREMFKGLNILAVLVDKGIYMW